ncbi:transmembrane protein 267 isoform X1 [Athene noctua]|uniref:transmembrane protein 267 isoform X1 n=1 Tax=Athene noctua TaxID=126797 RepID=UPI003EB7E352
MVFAMASETEKAHALLQTFSTASVISSLGLGIFCFVADRILQFSFIQQNDWLRALSDNAVHGILGMWSWAIVIGLRKKSDFTEVTLAGFLASVIDVDHFFLAGSLSLKVLGEMDVNLVTVLAILAVAVSQTSETLFPGAFNCCTKVSDEIPKGILRRVERFEIQTADGLCHLEAVILYIEGRKFCVSPRIRKFKKWMKKHKIPRKKPHGRKHRRIIKKKRNGNMMKQAP